MAIYLDTSAVVKLIVPEAESAALLAFLVAGQERISSKLMQLEVMRALGRDPENRPYWRKRADAVLQTIAVLELDETVLAAAGALPPPELRSLDAIHLASALSVPGLTGMVTYDRRLAAAGLQAGLTVWAPGQSG